MKTKHVLIGLGITALAVGGFFGIRYYRNKKKEGDNKSTEKQFEDLVNTFNKSGKDVFQGIAPEMYKKALGNFLKNISRQEADELIKIAVKKESEMTLPEKTKIITAIGKITNIVGEKQKSSSQEELATVVEARELVSKGINLANRVKKENWLSKLKGTDPTPRNNFYEKFKNAKITIGEYNAMAKFLDEYENNETYTLNKLSQSEKDLIKSFYKKIGKI